MRARSRDERGAHRRNRRRSRSVSSADSSDASADEDAPRADAEALSFEHLEAIRGVSLISRNEYPLAHLPRDKLFKPDDADAVCYCTFPNDDDDDGDTSRCDDVSCLNFATYIECSPDKCDAGKFCQNQRLQHPQRFPELEAFKTENKGFGVRARSEIKQHTVIGEYVGEIIDEKELQRRLKGVPRHELNFYYLALEPGVYIDARNKGSFTRFVNHSCEPNCKTEKWTVNGETRIAVVALRPIQAREELTFDYQWKSLGSMQIKCYCGSANCKGVIGSESDPTKTLVDNGPRGFYRDPTKEESGEALIGRHLRLFLSASDTSIYTIATVRGYNAEDESYELEYGDQVGTPQDAAFDSPLSAMDEPRNPPVVKLGERSWQIFVELTGLTEDQLEKAVFAIPKRRPSGTPGDSPGKSDQTAATTSPSQSSTTPSSTPGAGMSQLPSVPVVREERRDQDGELLDHDGDIVTNKLLIKGLPAKCDEALLRKLFIAPRKQRSSTMLEKLHSSVVAQQSLDAIVVKLDYFFFDETSGWALIEFSDPYYPKYFRRNLNSRDLLGQALRVFHAGRREVDNYERAKRNAAIRREENKILASLRGESGATSQQLVVPKPYPYGRALDWLVTIERVEDSPSRRKGTSASLEEKMRAQYVNVITKVAKALHLEREDAPSSILALHRYFTFFPMQNVEFMAAGMLHIYLKAHGRKIAWPEFISEVYAAKYPSGDPKAPAPKLNPDSEVFKRCERQVMETEKDLLEGLMFDISSEDPYGLLDMLTSTSKYRRKFDASAAGAKSQPPMPTDVQKEAKHLLSETLRLPVWAHTSVECVILSIVYIGAAVTTALTFSGSDEQFVPSPIPAFLPTLDVMNNEKDALDLLDCASFIVDNLKERWVRLEGSAIAARMASRRTNPDIFDTEQFAVQRHKPVEITQRITMLLKTWIDLKNDQNEAAMSNQLAHMTLRELKKRRRTGSFNIVPRDTPAIKASEVLVLDPAPKGGHDQLHRPPRLHVSDIENSYQIRKRTFLGTVSSSLEGSTLKGKPLFLLPWPYREHEPVFSAKAGASRACVRELSTALIMTSRAPQHFLGLAGIVFPNEDKAGEDTDFSMAFEDEKTIKAQLKKTGHYCAFDQPLHLYSGLLDSRTYVPMPLRKRAIFDMISAIALCHEWSYVHRYVAPCNLFVFPDGIRLGGYHAIRKLSLKAGKGGDSGRYEMSDSERKEHCHGSWMLVTPPEVLLGDRTFTMKGDIWSAGCVALMLLFESIPLLQGADLKAQINLIFRLCGTPSIMWPDGMKLSQYEPLKPKREYKMRLRKTLLEHRQDKNLPVPTEAIDLLEAMLQLDPSKRCSAKKLLEMEYFAEFSKGPRQEMDYSALPSTFDAQRRKLEHQLMKASAASAKRRRTSEYERPDSASSTESSKSRRHSSSSSRRTSSANEDEGNGVQDDDYVPLPDHLQDVVLGGEANGSSHSSGLDEPASKRRAKLGWGMGLNS